MIWASCASGTFWTSGARRSGTFMLFPTAEPLPSGPWHIAHFVLKVELLAVLSGEGFACVLETTKNARPTKTANRIAEAFFLECCVLSCVMAIPLLAIFLLQLRMPLQHRAQKLLTK